MSDEEIESHLRMAIRERVERRERRPTREVWAWSTLEHFLQDLRFGLRILTQSPLSPPPRGRDRDGNRWKYRGLLHGQRMMKPMPGMHRDNLVSVGMMADRHIDDPWNSIRITKHSLNTRASTTGTRCRWKPL